MPSWRIVPPGQLPGVDGAPEPAAEPCAGRSRPRDSLGGTVRRRGPPAVTAPRARPGFGSLPGTPEREETRLSSRQPQARRSATRRVTGWYPGPVGSGPLPGRCEGAARRAWPHAPFPAPAHPARRARGRARRGPERARLGRQHVQLRLRVAAHLAPEPGPRVGRPQGAQAVDSALRTIARWRSEDMVDRGYFRHTIKGTSRNTCSGTWSTSTTTASSSPARTSAPPSGPAPARRTSTEWVFEQFMDSTATARTSWARPGTSSASAPSNVQRHFIWTALFADRCSTGDASRSRRPSRRRSRPPGPGRRRTPTATPKPAPGDTPGRPRSRPRGRSRRRRRERPDADPEPARTHADPRARPRRDARRRAATPTPRPPRRAAPEVPPGQPPGRRPTVGARARRLDPPSVTAQFFGPGGPIGGQDHRVADRTRPHRYGTNRPSARDGTRRRSRSSP